MRKKTIKDYFVTCQEDMIQNILKLIRIDSVKQAAKPGMPFGEKTAAALHLAAEMAQEMGFAVKNYDNYVITIDMNNQEPGLDILAHLDVVPAQEADWHEAKPFEPVVKDGKIIGRGASDDKGPAMAALYAMKAVHDLEIPLKCNVRLILGADEESGSKDIEYYYTKEKAAPMTFSPDSDFPVINCEKGGYWSAFSGEFQEVTRGARILSFKGGMLGNAVPDSAEAKVVGIEWQVISNYCGQIEQETGILLDSAEENGIVQVNAHGTAAHASNPAAGNNAITGLLRLLGRLPLEPQHGTGAILGLAKMFPHGDYHGNALNIAIGDAVSGNLTLSINILEYDGQSISGRIDCRTPVSAVATEVVTPLQECFRQNGLTLHENRMVPAHHVLEDAPFIQTLLSCYEEYTGEKGYCITTSGSTYAHHIDNAVAFGCTFPGGNNHMHGADEFIKINELVISAEIFTQAIIELCS